MDKEFNKIEVEALNIGDTIEDGSYMRLETTESRFSFLLESPDRKSRAEGYVDLTEDELASFKSAFKRIADNAERTD